MIYRKGYILNYSTYITFWQKRDAVKMPKVARDTQRREKTGQI